MIRRWRNLGGSLSRELVVSDGILFDSRDDSPLGLPAPFGVFDGDWLELRIHFHSTGYYDPGKTSLAPEHCYPPEGSDERTLAYAEIRTDNPNDGWIKVDDDTAQRLFDLYYDAIMDVELEDE